MQRFGCHVIQSCNGCCVVLSDVVLLQILVFGMSACFQVESYMQILTRHELSRLEKCYRLHK